MMLTQHVFRLLSKQLQLLFEEKLFSVFVYRAMRPTENESDQTS